MFDDVDTGESRSFGANESCVLPIRGVSGQSDTLLVATHNARTCSADGILGPFSFVVQMHEEDSGFFHNCFSDFPFRGGSFESVESALDSNDELIGRRTLAFTAEEPAAAMPNVGDTVEETIKLGPCHDERAGSNRPVFRPDRSTPSTIASSACPTL